MTKNLLRNQYLTFDDVLSLDETFLDDISLIFLINVTSAMILGSIITKTNHVNNLTVEDLIELIDDLIYEKKRGGYPCFVVLHGDKSPLYSSTSFINLLEKYNIKFSCAVGKWLQNQVSESYNNVVKRNVCKVILEKYSRSEIIALNRSLPERLAKKSRASKASDKEFRNIFFKKDNVKDQIFMAIPEAIELTNNAKHSIFKHSSRREVEKIIRNAEKPNVQPRELRLAARGTSSGSKFISAVNNAIETKKSSKEKLPLSLDSHYPIILPEIMPGHENQTTHSFIEQLRQANRDTNVEVINAIIKAVEILGSHSQEQAQGLRMDNQNLQKRLDYLVEQAKIAEDEKEAARIRKEKRAKAKRDRKRDAIKEEHFEAALEIAKRKSRNCYIQARNRCALTLLFITGLRSSELRFITVGLVKELFQHGTMGVDRNKRGMKNKPATLTVSGRKTLAKNRDDFHFMFMHKKNDAAYFFSPMNREDTPLTRETIQRDLNSILDQLKTQFPGLYFRTHSMRAGYITKLWRKGFDINKIRQAIGHKSISITQGYVEDMDEAELQIELSNLE